MKILLAHNSLYYPSHGGGDKSNRLLMQALAARGHQVRVVSRVEAFGAGDAEKLLSDLAARGIANPEVTPEGVVHFELHGVDVRTVAYQSNIRPVFAAQIEQFDPDIIITSTDDPGQLLFDLAVKAPRARVIYLIRATIAVPFGPDASSPNAGKTDALKGADAVVGVSEYVAAYARQHGPLPDAVHVPISLLEPGPEAEALGGFEHPYVTMVNPCAVKGIDIFVALADRMPETAFAAVPTWGTNPDDYAALQDRPNITIIPPVDNIDDLMRQTRVLLVPSVWAEARSRIVVEAMERGVPVVASNAGGIPEAHLGVPYLIPVRLIERYRPALDMNMVPVAEVPDQDIKPWVDAVTKLTTDAEHWREIAAQSREAALAYARSISVEPFEKLLLGLLEKPKKGSAKPAGAALSEEKRKLLALRLAKQHHQPKAAPGGASALLAGADQLAPGAAALICFPWAGGGTSAYLRWREALAGVATPVAVRLPGREARAAEPVFETMESAVAAMGPAIADLLDRHPRAAFFGHSMGAGLAFEVARWLRASGRRLPNLLIVSGGRAPQYRLNQAPLPPLSDEELIGRVRLLGGIPEHLLNDPRAVQVILPAFRADLRLFRQYRYTPADPLPVPLVAFGADQDPNYHPGQLEEWRVQTTAQFDVRVFAGGHFYLTSDESTAAFLSALRETLAAQRQP